MIDDNHVDNEQEAADFINDHVSNSTVFIMNMTMNDAEQDCTPLQGFNALHEFRYFNILEYLTICIY